MTGDYQKIRQKFQGDNPLSKSLQDQLLKAGLANKKQAVRAKKAKNSKDKLKRAGKDVADEVIDAVEKSKQEKLAKDRELNEQKNRKAKEAAIQAQIAQLVELNALSERGDVEFRFSEGKTIKTLSVSEQQHRALVAGVLAIVKLKETYGIVPRKTAEKIAERDESKVILMNSASDDEQFEDEYAEFKVPDDLMW